MLMILPPLPQDPSLGRDISWRWLASPFLKGLQPSPYLVKNLCRKKDPVSKPNHQRREKRRGEDKNKRRCNPPFIFITPPSLSFSLGRVSCG